MKLARKLLNICENIDNTELNKFLAACKEHVLKVSPKTIKDDTLLLNKESAEITFNQLSKSPAGSNDSTDLENSLDSIGFDVVGLKDLLSSIFNEYVTQDTASSEIDDEQLVQFFLKHLKGIEVGFAGNSEINYGGEDDLNSQEFELEGTGKINDFKYDAKSDALTIDDFDVTEFTKWELA
jgi:hypothetical protein